MKKTLEYVYIFSKLSTSFILLLVILILCYFFYTGFKNQEKSNNDKLEFFNRSDENAEKLTKLSKKILMTDTTLDEIKKILQNNSNENNFEEISLLNSKIEELYSQVKKISINLKEIKSIEISKSSKKQDDNNSSIILNKNKTEIAKLVIYRFQNNLDYGEELNILQSLNNQSKQHIFEKINLVSLKNFRGNIFLKKVYSQELDYFLKENSQNYTRGLIYKTLMRFISIEPSKINIIKNNEINTLNEISIYLDQKKFKKFLNKITDIKKFEKYFSESIRQIKIAVEFEELIRGVS